MRVSAGPIGAVGVGHAAQFVDGADEGTDEEEVDKGDKVCRVFGAAVEEQCAYGPSDGECGHYEEHEDVGGSALELTVEEVDEPCLGRVSCGIKS